MKAEADAFRGQRAEPKAKPPGIVPTAPQARLDRERDRVASPLRDEAKELGKTATPSGPPKVAEPSQEQRAKRPESGVAARPLEPSAPRPTESPAPAPERQPSALPSQSADELYSAAGRDLSRQNYDQAVSGFRTFITEHPRDARIPDARLRLADAYVVQQRYADAIREYETLVRESPGSPLIPAALYRLGQARLALGDQAGCRVLRDLADRYPAAPEAALAREALTTRCP
jgi:tol-pal system protein YbgF